MFGKGYKPFDKTRKEKQNVLLLVFSKNKKQEKKKKRTKTACYTHKLLESSPKDREIIKKKKKRKKNYSDKKKHCIASNSIRCLKSLENLLSTKPILWWREVPAQETKDSDSAKDDACLSNTSDD